MKTETKPPAVSLAQRQANLRERRGQEGLTEVRGLYARVEDHSKIKAFAKTLLTGQKPRKHDMRVRKYATRPTVIEAVARALCSGCGDPPDGVGDARGNEKRWQDYTDTAQEVIAELQAAESGDVGRSAIPHLCSIVCASFEDDPNRAFEYTGAAGDAARSYWRRRPPPGVDGAGTADGVDATGNSAR